MIGYACDEFSRIHRLDENKQSIMVTLGVKEIETFDICRKHNLLSPLYDLGIKRDGCFFCPNCAKKEREILINNFPETLKTLCKDIEETPYYELVAKRNNWIKWYMTENK